MPNQIESISTSRIASISDVGSQYSESVPALASDDPINLIKPERFDRSDERLHVMKKDRCQVPIGNWATGPSVGCPLIAYDSPSAS